MQQSVRHATAARRASQEDKSLAISATHPQRVHPSNDVQGRARGVLEGIANLIDPPDPNPEGWWSL